MTSLLQNHPFCRFSEQIKQQAQDALSALKNRYDLNNDLLLFCYWYAANNQGLLSKTHIRRLLASIYAWHEKIVAPLNTLCTQLKEAAALELWPDDSVYEHAVNALLTSEQIEQCLIAEALPRKPKRGGRVSMAQTGTHACLNVATYCQIVYVCLDEKDYPSLSNLISAVFPEVSTQKAASFVRKVFAGRQTKEPLQKNLSLFESD